MAMLALSINALALRKFTRICEEHTAAHGLTYNVKKIEYIVFGVTGKNSPDNVLPVIFDGIPFNRASHIKYLGYFIGNDLKENMDIECESRALSVRTCAQFCWMYGGDEGHSIQSLLHTTERRCPVVQLFKTLLWLPRLYSTSAMFAESHGYSFTALLGKKSASLLNRIRGSCNNLPKTIAALNAP